MPAAPLHNITKRQIYNSSLRCLKIYKNKPIRLQALTPVIYNIYYLSLVTIGQRYGNS